MMHFRGRLHFRQYIPNKSHKYGVKLYKLRSPEGCTFNVIIYTGKGDTVLEFENSQSIVIRLLECVEDKNDKTLYADNYYSSIPLAICLLKKKMMYCGTLMTNRKGLPPSFVSKKELKKGRNLWEEKRYSKNHKMDG